MRTSQFEYDELSRLIKEDTYEARSYVLDPVGNDTAQGGQYNELNQLLENNDYSFEYDLNGNLTKKASKFTGDKFEYTWTAENELKSVKVFNKTSTLWKTLTFSYDGLGRRIIRSVLNHLEASKSYTQKFIYDGEHILAILDGDDKFVSGYIYGTKVDDPMGMVTDYDQDGELDVLSFIKDRQNSVKAILNDKQELVQEVYYSAYGETQIVSRGQVKHKIGNAFYYTSRELDSDTGDYYYRARYYDPKVGRFLSEDPIGFSGGDVNLYRYVENMPVISSDPSGQVGIVGIVGIGGVVGGVSGALGAYIGGERNLCNIADAAVGGAISGIVTVGTTLGTIVGGIGTGSAVFTGIIFGTGASAIGNAISPFGNSGLCSPKPPACEGK